MNTNRDIVHLVKTEIKEIHGDSYLSNRAILSKLVAVRNLLVKREIDKRRLKDVDTIYTTIPCLEMVEVPLSECCSYTSPCKIRRSKHPLPKIGESLWGYIIEGVWNIDGDVQFDLGSAKTYANLLDLLDKQPNMYWIQNDYLYVSDKDIETLRVRLFLEDLELNPKLFKCSEEFKQLECLNPLDMQFKCPGYLVNDIVNIVVQNLVNITKRLPTDQTDNDTQLPN